MAVNWANLTLVAGSFEKVNSPSGRMEQAKFYALTANEATFPVRNSACTASGVFTAAYVVDDVHRLDLGTSCILTVTARSSLTRGTGNVDWSDISSETIVSIAQEDFLVTPELMALRRVAASETVAAENIIEVSGDRGTWMPDVRLNGAQVSATEWSTYYIPHDCPFTGKPEIAYLLRKLLALVVNVTQYTKTAPASLPFIGISSAANIPSTGDMTYIPNRTTAGFWVAAGRTYQPQTDSGGDRYWIVTSTLRSVPLKPDGTPVHNEESDADVLWDSTKNGGVFTWGTF